MKSKVSRAIGPAAMVIAVSIALLLLERELKSYHYRDLMRQVWTLPHSHLALALLLTTVAYAVLPGYDAIALSYVDHPLPVRRIAFGSFIAYALSHSLGFPLLSGGPVRYRFWSVWGLSTSEIAQAISFPFCQCSAFFCWRNSREFLATFRAASACSRRSSSSCSDRTCRRRRSSARSWRTARFTT